MNKNFENIIQNWSKAQKAGAILPCPKCGRMIVQMALFGEVVYG